MQKPFRISLPFSAAATNLSIAVLLALGAASGLGIFLASTERGSRIDWLHAIAGFSLALLLMWKRRIIIRSLRRHGLGAWALPSLVLLVLLVSALATGMLWSTTGLPGLGPYSALTVHAALGAVLAVAVLPHALPRLPASPARVLGGRRALLRGGLLLAAGAAFWRSSEIVSGAARLSGARRRFTGSREIQSFENNAFPAESWLLDDPEPIEPATWRLRLTGSVAEPLALELTDLDQHDEVTALLDCTGGWYSRQRWQGIALSRLIERAAPRSGARSVVVHSKTGYWRRFPLDSASRMLLAVAIGGETLVHEHGAPLRLVAPNHRGYDWVKWVTEVEISPLPSWLRWPLPLW
jgi:hypothetical protein